MTRTMGDSTTFTDIPKGVDIVAVYVSGHLGVVTPAELEARFPHSQYGHVTIDVTGFRPDADVRDWETGDKAGSLQDWVIAHNKASGKRDAVIYCNRSTIAEVRQLTGSQILNRDYFLWITTLDGTKYTGEGVIACQDKGEKQTGGHWDESTVYDNTFWKALPPATAAGTPVVSSGAKATGKPDVLMFQRAVRVEADNLWGPETDRHANAVIQAAGDHFPYGVIFAQQIVDTRQDGQWGPASKAMLRETIISVQNALTGMGFSTKGIDGIWGPNTNAAYSLARKACHI
jgi:hypothetical protein